MKSTSEAYSGNNDKMKNLAGETKADLHILEELDEAGIEVVEGGRSKGEVPYTLTGKLGDWNFSRAWYYWMADAEDGKGLSLEIATELHNREYPIKGEGQPETCGQVVRVAGHCGCPAPKGWANHYDSEGRMLSHDSKGKTKKFLEEAVSEGTLEKEYLNSIHLVRTVKELKELTAKSFVDSYHVDTQEGLNALAGAIRTLHNMASSGTDPEEIKRLHDKISSLYVEWETSDKQGDVEWLKKLPTIEYGGRNVNELLVGIKGGCEVVSIAKIWESIDGRKGVAQHFFEDGQITGFNYGHISGPSQIINRGPEVDERLRPHYEEVKKIRPNAAQSLELCMQELEKPGPEYTGRPDGSISLKLSGK